ncbi:hypothetical protein PybrP1_011920 [[Pythium] brassicae (nom. inval.)]|nr:hypothetical protein PybrP1_011920 [[Pythium] brassicae (nom. inval.)]
MGRKKHSGGAAAKGIPGRLRAEKERREVDAKLKQLRIAVARVRALAELSEPDVTEATAAVFYDIRRLALAPRGFVTESVRCELWLFLAGRAGFEPLPSHAPMHFVARCGAPHRDDAQVEKDIDRSLWHYDVVKGIRESERRSKRRALTHVINATLSTNEQLHYYQGYHDVCSVFLLALGEQRAFEVAQRVSATYHREAMGAGFETVMQATRLVFPLLKVEDSELHAHIRASGVEPYFALPWVITWFAHQLPRFQDVARLYDAFLVSHPLFCVYVSATLVLEARARVLKCECDFGTMHSLLSKLPQVMEIEKVIARATVLLHSTPPSELLRLGDFDTATLEKSTFFQCPYEYQTHFGVEKPFLQTPAVSKKTKKDASTMR